MNTLRILSLVCGASRIKHLISLLTLLLLWPAFASAACSPTQVCVATSGITVTNGDPEFPFNFAGNGFSASGVLTEALGNLAFGLLFEYGSYYDEFFGGATPKPLAQFELTVNGVPWGMPAGGGAGVSFTTDSNLYTGSEGTWSSPFSFGGFFTGAPEPFSPGLGCDVLNCVTLEFRGSGMVTYDVSQVYINAFAVSSPQTFTFAAVPEPATLSLFAVGLVGLAMRRKAVAALRTS